MSNSHNGSSVKILVDQADDLFLRIYVKVTGQPIPLGAFEGRSHIVAFFAAVSFHKVEHVTSLAGDVIRSSPNVSTSSTSSANDIVQLPQLSEILSTALPRHMMPSLMIPMLSLPKTSSSKLDRKALVSQLRQAPLDFISQYTVNQESQIVPESTNSPCSNMMELRKLWSVVLSMDEEKILSRDSFLALGGDSILAMRLSSMATTNGNRLSVPDIIQHPSLSAMAQCLRGLEVAPDQVL
jgi:aryl carrier-like protein